MRLRRRNPVIVLGVALTWVAVWSYAFVKWWIAQPLTGSELHLRMLGY